MSVDINGVACLELVEGYREGADPQPSSTKKYICTWADRYRVASGLLGFSHVVGGRNGQIVFTPPYRHPELTALCGRTLTITGAGRPHDGPRQLAFDQAIIEVNFGPLNWEATAGDDPENLQGLDPDTPFLYASQEIDYGVDFATVPGSSLQYVNIVGTAKSFNQDMPIKVQHAEMAITLHRLPYMPVDFLPLVDRVNGSKFLGCDTGTVRFNGGKTHREQQSDGSVTQSVNFSFSYRPGRPWNTIPDPEGSAIWVKLQYKDGTPLYPPTDLSLVFPRYYLS